MSTSDYCANVVSEAAVRPETFIRFVAVATMALLVSAHSLFGQASGNRSPLWYFDTGG